MAAFRLKGEPAADHRLSAWIRQQNLTEAGPPTILQESLEQLRQVLPTYSVSGRSMQLLRNLAAITHRPGVVHSGNLRADVPLAWAEDQPEFEFHIRSLGERGLIKVTDRDTDSNYRVSLTPSGWEYVETGAAAVQDRAFVAMSFADDMGSAWSDGLRPGIESAGFEAHRVDSQPHVSQIDQKIVADIKTSLFVVADVTQQKQGVYFEAGLALGLGKTVIWTVQEEELARVHFDTRQFAHIIWSTPEDLRAKLRDVVIAVVGVGPLGLKD